MKQRIREQDNEKENRTRKKTNKRREFEWQLRK